MLRDWPSSGLAPAIPGRVAPDWISPDPRPTTTAAHASQAFLAHHSPYALGVDAPALGMRCVGDTPAAIAPPALVVDLHDRLSQRCVHVAAWRTLSGLPGD